MSRRSKIIIAALIVLALLLLALYFLLLRRPEVVYINGEAVPIGQVPAGFFNTSPNLNRDVPDAPVNVNTAPPPPPAKPDERSNLRRIAAAFAERYGSFSNQSNFENVLDLKVYMSAEMATWADEYVEEARKRPRTAEYFGVTSRAINTNMSLYNEDTGKAQVIVTTQRQETSGSQIQGEVYYQDITIDFTKEGDAWKVTGATWQQRAE